MELCICAYFLNVIVRLLVYLVDATMNTYSTVKTHINNWTVMSTPSGHALMGKITGHPNPAVGVLDRSLTSDILGRRWKGSVDGHWVVVTKSGTEYELDDSAQPKVISNNEYLMQLTEV